MVGLQLLFRHCSQLKVGLLLAKLPVFPISLFEYVRGFTWPASIASKISVQNVLRPGEGFRGSASEGLSVYGIIRSYLQHYDVLNHHDEDVQLAAHSFLLLCELLDFLKTTMTGMQHNHQMLKRLVLSHLRSFAACYGEEHMIPKHHFTLHLHAFLAQHQVLLKLGPTVWISDM